MCFWIFHDWAERTFEWSVSDDKGELEADLALELEICTKCRALKGKATRYFIKQEVIKNG